MDSAMGTNYKDGVSLVIQARMSSSRFPEKMMADLCGMPLIKYVYLRCFQSRLKCIVATSDDKTDDPLYTFCRDNGIPVMRGSLHSVLDRYIQAGLLLKTDYMVRVCGDTPFVDIALIHELTEALINGRKDLVALDKRSCAAGFYSEAFTVAALKKTISLTDDGQDLEHVTRYIFNNPDKFMVQFVNPDLNPGFMGRFRLTIDYPEDIATAGSILDLLTDKLKFTSRDVLNILQARTHGQVL